MRPTAIQVYSKMSKQDTNQTFQILIKYAWITYMHFLQLQFRWVTIISLAWNNTGPKTNSLCSFLFQCDVTLSFYQDSEISELHGQREPIIAIRQRRSQLWYIMENQTNTWQPKFKNLKTATPIRTYGGAWSDHKIQRKIIFQQYIPKNNKRFDTEMYRLRDIWLHSTTWLCTVGNRETWLT